LASWPDFLAAAGAGPIPIAIAAAIRATAKCKVFAFRILSAFVFIIFISWPISIGKPPPVQLLSPWHALRLLAEIPLA
jgi:hypothetical protein